MRTVYLRRVWKSRVTFMYAIDRLFPKLKEISQNDQYKNSKVEKMFQFSTYKSIDKKKL